MEPFDIEETKIFGSHSNESGELGKQKHSKTKHKSFDASIMDIADDIAYGVHDLEDAVALNLVTESQWQDEVMLKINKMDDKEINHLFNKVTGKLFGQTNIERKSAIGDLVHAFITGVEVIEKDEMRHGLLRFKADVCGPQKIALDTLKDFVVTNVIKKPEVQVLEYKGQQIVMQIFQALESDPKRLLPQNTYSKYCHANNRYRVISDYVSGMTNNYATKLFNKLFNPSIGSVFDRL